MSRNLALFHAVEAADERTEMTKGNGVTMSEIEDQMKAIRQRLFDARIGAGLTQYQAAKLMGLNSAATISHYESGLRDLTVETLLRLCAVYGVSQLWVLTGVNPAFDRDEIANLLAQSNVSMPDAVAILEMLEMQP